MAVQDDVEKRILVNRIRCKQCNDIIESKYRHDFKHCSCGAVFIDGGTDYCRYGWPEGSSEDYIEIMTEYELVPKNEV